jgi:hypothetical protein
MNEVLRPRLLLKTHPGMGATLVARRKFALKGITFRIDPLFSNEDVGNPLAIASSSRWYLAEADTAGMSVAELWDLAHVTVGKEGLGLDFAPGSTYVEPDLASEWLYENKAPVVGELGVAPGELCAYNDQRGPPLAQGPGFAWHLGAEFSQLKQAREEVEKLGPDLVNRLSIEAAKSAQHVLTMCIRALDYCPPVDLSFGDFLRALITADFDIVPDDSRGYRVAFVEAFRRRGLYPRDVRTLSVDSLRWQEATQFGSENLLATVVETLRPWAHEQQYLECRQDIFTKTREQRIKLHGELKTLFEKSSDPERLTLSNALGIDLLSGHTSFEVHSLRQALKVGPDGTTSPQLIIEITQERDAWMEADGSSQSGQSFRFTGGCTIIADQRTCKVRYHILKNVLSDTRLQRQRQYYLSQNRSLEALYFHTGSFEDVDEPFALLHRLHAAGDDTYG